MRRFQNLVPISIRRNSNKKVKNLFFGLEIERKTNVLSLVAFLLSIAGIAGQIYFFIQGPKVALQPPEAIVFYSLLSSNDEHYLHITSQMAYVNTGQPGFNDAIKRETAVLHIGNKILSFRWYKYVNSSNVGSKFIENPISDARPVAVNAGSIEAHETSFTPIPESTSIEGYGKNYLKFSEFKELALAEKEIFVYFQYETFAGTKGKVSCKVLIGDSFRHAITKDWSTPQCVR